MSETAHMILICSLVLGILVLYQLVQLRREHRVRQLTFYFQALAGIYLISMGHLSESFLKLVIPADSFPGFLFVVMNGVALFFA